MSSEEDDLDPGGLDEFDESECWGLPATQSVGSGRDRRPLSAGFSCQPPGRRSQHRVSNRVGTKLWSTTCSNVGFEVDYLDLVDHAGWSVLMRGSRTAPRLRPNCPSSGRRRSTAMGPEPESTWCVSWSTALAAAASDLPNCLLQPSSAATCNQHV